MAAVSVENKMLLGFLTCSPEHRVIEKGELHLSVVFKGRPASWSSNVDVGHVERNLHRQKGLGRVPHLKQYNTYYYNPASLLFCCYTRNSAIVIYSFMLLPSNNETASGHSYELLITQLPTL